MPNEDVLIRVGADAKALNRGMSSAERRIEQSKQRIGRDLRGMNDNFKRSFGNASRTVETNSARMQRSMGKTRGAMRGLVTVFAALGAARLGKSFLGFETALQRTVGLVGVAQSEVNEFKEQILELGPAVGRGPRELAEALFFITSAGLRGADAMSTLEAAAKAATAGLGETKVVADAVTSAMNAYASEGLTAAEATDSLVTAVRLGKFEASDLASALGRILPFAVEASVSLDEVNATVAAMTRIGAPATEVISGLRGVLIALTKESDKGAKVLDRYGLSYAGIRAEIREKGLLVALTSLRKEIGANETALSAIFGRAEAAGVVLGLTGKNAALVATIFEGFETKTGNLDKAFAAMADTAEFRFNAAMSRVSQTTMSIAADIMPALATSLEFAAANMRLLVTAAGAFIAFKLAGVLVAATAALAGLAAAAGVAATAMLALQAALLGPIGLAIALVAALVAGIIILTRRTNDAKTAEDKFKDTLASLNDELKTAKERTDDLAQARRDAVLAAAGEDLAAEEEKLAKFQRIRDAFERRQASMVGKADRFRQEIDTRTLANNAKIEESEQRILDLKTKIAAVEAAPLGTAADPVEIVPFVPPSGEGGEEAAAAIDKLKSKFNALRDALDPLAAATRKYTEDVDTLIAATKANLQTEDQELDRLNALREARNEARFPIVAIEKALAEQLKQARMNDTEREIHIKLLSIEAGLRAKGTILTKEETASIRDQIVAIRDATAARKAQEKAVEDQAQKAAKTAAEQAEDQKQLAEDFKAQWKDTFTDIIKRTVGVGDAFEKLGQRILDMLVEIALNDLLNGTNRLGSGGGLGGLVNLLGGIGGGGRGGIPDLGAAGNPTPVFEFHKGGIVGRDGKLVGMTAANSNAPRFHSGGTVGLRDDVNIIAKKGEEILTEDDPHHSANRGARISITNNFPNARNEPQIRQAGSEAAAKTASAAMRGLNRKGLG